jgi:hypothetical protein
VTATQQRTVAVAVGAFVLIVGLALALMRGPTNASDATVVLVPTPKDPDGQSLLLGSFDRSGTAGVYTELLMSGRVKRAPDAAGATVVARPVTDARVLKVTLRTHKGDARAALSSVVESAIADSATLGDLWRLQLLEPPSPSRPSGPPRALFALGAVVLAALAGLVALVLLRYLLAQPSLGAVASARGRADRRARVGSSASAGG